MKTLVTGVAGFIGSHIAERLLKDGHEVIGIDDFSAGYYHNVPSGVKLFCRDILTVDSEIMIGVDIIFHNAASKKNICLKNPKRDMEVNGIGTLHLLQECITNGVSRFIHASTGSVYGEVKGLITEDTPRNPCSYYGVSKNAGENYVMYFSRFIKTTILRYFHVFGERQEKNQETGGVVAIFTDKIRNNDPIIIHGNGKQKRVFTFIEDIVEANIQSMVNPLSAGKIYNCASSVQTDINTLAEILMLKYNNKVPINYYEPLEGDIFNFNVVSERIKEIGVTFRPITSIL
jgi:nucleoside-diphosphate-sugar epimerase